MAARTREELVERLHDSKARVRRQAVRQLAATRDPSVVPLLRTAYLSDEDDRVREAARDGLAMFKAMETTGSRRPFPVSDTALGRVLRLLAILLVISLLANGALMGISALGGNDDEDTPPTARTVLIDAFTERLDQATADIAALRGEIEHHNETDEVVCEASFNRPQPYMLSSGDRGAYDDLASIGDLLNPALTDLQQPQATWDTICQRQTASLIQGLEALKQLDRVGATLDTVRDALEKVMSQPVATATKPATLVPTQGNTAPDTVDTAVPEAPVMTEPGVTSTSLPPTPTPTITVTPKPTDTPTITPTATQTPLPYPDLEYDTILRQLSERLVILGDLQNSYQTGMIDYWTRAIEGRSVSTTFCALPAWPSYFFWDDAQRAQLDRADVADPELVQAVTLINAGLDNALPARALFESSCPTQTLASTANQGLTLAQQAVSDFNEAKQLIDNIRGRR